MYRADFYFQFPSEDPLAIPERANLGSFISDQDDIWRALAEAQTKRAPIASALISAYPSLHYVKYSEIEIHLKQYDPQLPLFGAKVLINGGPS